MTIILIIIFFLIGAFVLQGLRKIPIPYVGQVTIFGKRKTKIDSETKKEISVYRKEGWNFLPLFPFWYGIVLIKVERITFEVIQEKAMTPDRAESRVPVLLTIRPVPEMLKQYINSGKEEGVKAQLVGKIEERIREWCMSDEEGPKTWMELNKSHSEGTSILAKKIAGNSLVEVPSYAQKVPTWIWLRYFKEPQPEIPLGNEEKWYDNGWQKVKDALDEISKMKKGESNIKRLKKAVEERRKQIDSLRTGTGEIIVEDLGVQIERLNIGDIDVLGKVADTAENEAKEEQERKAETKEVEHVLGKVKMYKDMGYSLEQALEAVQTERGKVSKSIQETKLNISPETRKMIEDVFSVGKQIVENLKDKGGK